MDETREIDIDLRKIIYMMRTKIIFVILITVAVGTLTGLYTHFFVDPIYSASINLCVYNNPDRVTTDQSVSSGDLSASQDLVQNYMYILRESEALNPVAQDVGMSEASDIAGYISTSKVEGTTIFRVIVSCKDPQLAADIANSIAKYAPTELPKVAQSGGVSVLKMAKVPRTPSSPNTKKNILVGSIAGFVISFAAFFIYEMFDTTITNTKDLERDFDIPILGTVPTLDKQDKKQGPVNIDMDDEDEDAPDLTAPKPSSALLENIQSMKGDAKNDKA